MENTMVQFQNVFFYIHDVFWVTDFDASQSFGALREFGAPRLFASKDTNGAIIYPHLKADGKYIPLFNLKMFFFLCMFFFESQILAPLGVLAPLDFHRWGGLGPHGPPCHHATA